jgi:hypothetical protein
VRLQVRDRHTTGDYDALRVIPKGGKPDVLVIHPETAQRSHAYLTADWYGQDRDGMLVRRLNESHSGQDGRRALRQERVEWVVRTYTQGIQGFTSRLDRRHQVAHYAASIGSWEDYDRGRRQDHGGQRTLEQNH